MSLSFPGWILLTLGITVGGTCASAEAIPAENIRAQHQSCVTDCARAGVPSDYCETQCSCFDREVARNFSFEEFKILDKAVEGNPSAPAFPPDLKGRLDDVMKICS